MSIHHGFTLPRSVVNVQAGAKTQMAAAFSVLIVIISLLLLTPLFYWLPKATLAASIIASAIGMVDIEAYKIMFKVKPRDFIIAVLTAVITFGATIQIGLIVGIGLSLASIVLRATSAHEAILGEIGGGQTGVFRDVERKKNAVRYPKIIMYRFDGALHFANVERFRSHVVGLITGEWRGGPGSFKSDYHEMPFKRQRSISTGSVRSGRSNRDYDLELSSVKSKDKPRFIIVDGSGINDIDASAAAVLVGLSSTLRKRGNVKLLFAHVKGQVRDVLWRATEGRFDPPTPPDTPDLPPNRSKGGIRRDQFFLSLAGALKYAQDVVAFEEERQKTLTHLFSAGNDEVEEEAMSGFDASLTAIRKGSGHGADGGPMNDTKQF